MSKQSKKDQKDSIIYNKGSTLLRGTVESCGKNSNLGKTSKFY